MNWWQTSLISIGISLFTALISFISAKLYNKEGRLKFYIANLSIKGSYFECDLVVYNPSNIPKLFQWLILCLYNKKQFLEERKLETSSPDRRNSLGEIQGYYVEPTMINSKEMVHLTVYCSVKDISKCNKLKIKYRDYRNKVVLYDLVKCKTNIIDELDKDKINS